MPRFQKNDNFIDKTFTVLADIVLKVLPASKQEKEAFSYYRDGMSAQSEYPLRDVYKRQLRGLTFRRRSLR